MRVLLSLFIFMTTISLWAAKGPLFQKGQEVFEIVDAQSKPLRLKVLKDSLTKQSVAIALNTAYQLNENPNEIQPYLLLHFEKMVLKPSAKDPNQLEVSLFISGKEYEINGTLSRFEFLSGKPILIKVPTEEKKVAIFQVKSQGQANFRFDKSKDLIEIAKVSALLEIEAPLGGEESEKIEFSGRGIRK